MFGIISVFLLPRLRRGYPTLRLNAEGGAKRNPRLRATRFARAFDLSGRAAAGILPRIFTNQARIFTLLSLSVPCFVLSVFIEVSWCG